MQEHIEAINHKEAIDFLKELVIGEISLSEKVFKEIHSLILSGINRKNDGKYRDINVRITGSRHIPPDYLHLLELMEKYFKFYEEYRYFASGTFSRRYARKTCNNTSFH